MNVYSSLRQSLLQNRKSFLSVYILKIDYYGALTMTILNKGFSFTIEIDFQFQGPHMKNTFTVV